MARSAETAKFPEQRMAFIGRVQEQRQFLVALQGLLAHYRRWTELAQEHGNDFNLAWAPGDDSYANIFLPHGIGGIGKSWLTRRCMTLAEGIPNDPPILTLYDDVSLGAPVLQPGHLLDRLAGLLEQAGYADQVAAYRQAKADTPAVVERVTRYQFENREQWDKLVKIATDLVARSAQETAHYAFDEISLAYTHASGAETAGKDALTLTKAYDLLLERMQEANKITAAEASLFRNPPAAQATRLVTALKQVAVQQPLVIGLDNLEIIIPLEPLIRDCLVLPTNQSPIIWLLTGRYNLADERVVELNGEEYIYKGYRDLLGENPPVVWDMSIFGDADLRDYLTAESERRRSPLLIDDDLIEAIKATSSGVPLVVEMVTDALFTMDRDEFLRDFALDDRSLLPDDRLNTIAERFLRYCLTNPQDMERVQAMALLRKGVDENALADIWGLGPDRSVREVLHNLRTRYAFVLPEGLHDAVYGFVRRQLRTSWQAHTAREQLSRRAVTHHQARWETLHQRFDDSTRRVRDLAWQRATRDYLNALLWYDPDQAVLFLLPRFVEGLGFDRAFSNGLLLQAEEFLTDSINTFSESYANLLSQMRIGMRDIDWTADEPGEAIGTMLASLLEAPGLAPLHLSILYVWQGNWLVENGRLDDGLAAYQQADEQMPAEAAGLRQQLGKAYYEISSRFLWPESATETVPSEQGLVAARRATELAPENGGAWFNYGVALDYLDRPKEAVAAYEKAIQREPRPNYFNNLGDVYTVLGRTDEAVIAYRQAIDLEPEYAWPYHNLGLIHAEQGDYQAALDYYQQAIEHHQHDKDRAVSWDNFGDAHAALGNSEEAISAYRWAGVLAPKYASPWFGLGNVYSGQERFREAIDAYQKTITLDSDHAWARHNLALVYSRQGDYATAIPYFQQAIERHGDNTDRAISWNSLGQTYSLLAQPTQAIDAYRQAINLDPAQADAWNNLGDVYMAEGDTDAAISAYRQAVQIEPDFAAPWNSMGSIYGALGRDDEAIDAYSRVITLEPDYAWPYNNVGYIHGRRGDYDTARDFYEQAVARHDDDNSKAVSWSNLGDVHVALGNADEATNAYRRAIALNPAYAWPYHNLALVYERQNNLEPAIGLYQQAIERHTRDQDRASSWFNLANVYQHQARHREAVDAYRRVLELDAREPEAWNNLGDSYRALERPDEAEEAYRQAIALAPGYASPYHSLGLLADAQDDRAAASGFYRQAIERHEDDFSRALSWNKLGDAHLALNAPDEAEQAYQQSVKLAPDYARPYYSLGAIAESRAVHEAALGFYQQAIDRYPAGEAYHPEQARAWNGLGNAYRALERSTEAIPAYRRATEFDDSLAAPWRSLADIFRETEQDAEAVTSYEAAIERAPAVVEPYHNLGLVHQRLGHNEEAVTRFRQALERYEAGQELARAVTWHHLGQAYRALEQDNEAIDAYQHAIRYNPDDDAAQVALGDIYTAQARYEAAIEAYEAAVELNPVEATPWNSLGNVYRTLERYSDATEAYEQAIALNPAAPEPYHSLGIINEIEGQPEPTISFYEQAIGRYGPEQAGAQALAWNGLGNIYRSQGQDQPAINAYQEAIKLDASLAEPYHSLGLIHAGLERPEPAIIFYQQAIERFPETETEDETLAQVWNDLGDSYSRVQRWLAAADAYQQAIDLDGAFALPWYNLGNVYSATDRPDEAIDAYRRAIDRDPAHAWSYNNLAMIYHQQQRDYGQAVTLYRQAIERHATGQDRAISWNNLGDVYQLRRQYNEAVEAYQQAIDDDPQYARPWKSLGDVYRIQRRSEGVIEAYQQAIDLEPDYAWPYHNLGLIHKGREEYRQSAIYYQQAIQRHQRDVDRAVSWNGLGNVFLAVGQYDPATDAFQKAIRLNPDDAWPYHNLGFVHKQRSRHQQAIGLYRQAIDRFQSDRHRAVSWNNLGNVYNALDRHKEAEEAYRHAIDLHERYALPWNSLGETLFKMERTEEAAEAYRTAIDINENYVVAWNNLGDAYVKLNRHTEAIEAYERSIALDEQYAWPYHNLALLYDERGDYEAAIGYYQQAIERHTAAEQQGVLADKMGELYRITGDTEQAIEAYRQSTVFDPTYASPWYSLGNIYAALEQNDEAVTAYRRAIELQPEDPWPYHNLALLYEKQEVYGEAIALYRQAIERQRTDRERAISWDSLGHAYSDLNRLEEARQAFQQAIQLSPNYAPPWNSLGDVYQALGEHEEAIDAYQQAIGLDAAYVWAYNNMGNVYESLGDTGQAIEIYRQATVRQDANPRALAVSWNNLGDIYDSQQRESEAIAAYEQAIQLDPDYTWSYNRLGAIYERRGERDQAFVLYRQATRRHRQRTPV